MNDDMIKVGERDKAVEAAGAKPVYEYLRKSINSLLEVMGTLPLSPEEIDDEDLIELDPLGIISGSFGQVLDHLNDTNQRLNDAHEELRVFFDSAGVAILVLDPSMNIIAKNSTAARILKTQDCKHCYEGICGEEAPPEGCTLINILETKKPLSSKEIGFGGNIYEVTGIPVFDEDQNIDNVVMTYADVTARDNALKAMEKSEKKYRDLFENANDLIAAFSSDGAFLYVNSKWKNALEWRPEDLDEAKIADTVAPEYKREFFQSMEMLRRGGGNVSMETSFISRSGKKLILDGNVTVSSEAGEKPFFRGIFRDITLQKKLEEESNKAQRLESVGFLAGGIAHDFNNLLTGILGNISLARLYKEEGIDIEPKLADAEKAILRAQNLTAQLLTFAKGGAPVKKLIRLEELISDSANFATSNTNVTYKLDIEKGLWPVEADPGQIDQVFQNLFNNSIHAMPDGGEITISGRNLPVDEAAELHLPIAAAPLICLTISDEGVGIDYDDLDKIFDPYFSTREMGMGLGLATVYSVVRNHGGYIAVESTPGDGTSFTIHLPAKAGSESGDSAESGAATESNDVNGLKKRLLVMDDDKMVVELVSELLVYLGYDVSKAMNGEDAIALYSQALHDGKPFDAVILDLTIAGGMGGKETVKELRKLDPSLKALASSGYSNDPVMSKPKEYGFNAVVAKPFRAATLSASLKKLFL